MKAAVLLSAGFLDWEHAGGILKSTDLETKAKMDEMSLKMDLCRPRAEVNSLMPTTIFSNSQNQRRLPVPFYRLNMSALLQLDPGARQFGEETAIILKFS
ncbi:hypothetical protein HYQ45_015325 [Verticillium longisporum]|uniref:Uncharacterized protein n=1 Tax=Verticillium longisporum TaxID=100787 RepID=A0A8I3AK96_VERLO|nr:hypothetical protein HYQ44_009613 [Verticillium longisporum]KAG7119053.1 hypothetical protein HYQ45_015325 [Verticillium longisporum]KAG7148071.1 hypothetical protein HYQ46_003067 [Verticillium longisporum]